MSYIPEQGGIIWLDLNPTLGSEQRGRRPIIVLTPLQYNKLGLMIAVPITNKVKGYNTEIPLSTTYKTQGVILTNHIRSYDWRKRNAEYIEKLDDKTLDKVLSYISTLIQRV